MNFFFFVAEECRKIMASLGIRSMNEMVGRADLLIPDQKVISANKLREIDLSQVLPSIQLKLYTTLYDCRILQYRNAAKFVKGLARCKPTGG